MSKPIIRSYKIVNWLLCRIFCNNTFQHLIIRISKKYRFNIRIIDTHMLHAIFFLITTSQFMFFYHAIHVVGYISSYDQSILRFPIHGLGINVITFFRILHQPSFLLKHTEIFYSLIVYGRIVFVCPFGKINFRFNDMIK